ncbi:UNKNOWN [Stylonychia lemnae]|uniref:Small ribosomal subunit protein mS35 mitochondrial conserved domain-containing protein n=1 Tax=Stylonychia lemnae TaxID=5949 RepID=A0A078A8Z2_STYLE|nr:UNKNOWN [Stylonychia lemnae]|eukprot:CDW78017.1 UNKNOWN [Stylonychia lemnae]
MSYNCIPEWQQIVHKDPFDYKLRSPEEIAQEHKYFPPDFAIEICYKKYHVGDTSYNSTDTRERIAKIRVDINTMKLTIPQKERFIYLLGPRYTGSSVIKIVSKQYNTFHENYMKAFELLREIYWEAKRAPDQKPEEHVSPYRRQKLVQKLYGRTKEERLETRKEYARLFEERKVEYENYYLGLEQKNQENAAKPVDAVRQQKLARRYKAIQKLKNIDIGYNTIERLENRLTQPEPEPYEIEEKDKVNHQ